MLYVIETTEGKPLRIEGLIFSRRRKMNDQLDQNETQKIDLEAFAGMVGFPSELIKKELFNSDIKENELTIKDLRAAMLKYLDSTMIAD